jgi:hypothetical protein
MGEVLSVSWAKGNTTEKVQPEPGLLSTAIEP